MVGLLGIQVSNNTDEIFQTCKQVVDNNPKQLTAYLNGKTKVLGFFIKQVMDIEKNAEPKVIKDILERVINEQR